MTLDTTQILILVIIAIIILDAIKDLVRDIHVWRLIEILAGKGQGVPTFPTPPIPVPPVPIPIPDPGPLGPPDKPPVAPDKPPITPPVTPPVPPALGIPRFTGVGATSFAGVKDSAKSKESAYYPGHYPTKVIDSNKPGTALPYHFPGTPPTIRAFWRGKTVDCPVVDVGPWNTNDPYWDHGGRPAAEAQYKNKTTAQNGRVPSNPAGIDLTPGAWAALGKAGDLDDVQDIISWDFVSVLDKESTTPVPLPPVGPTQPPITGGTILQHNTWPPQSQAMSFFGNPASSGWEAANLVHVTCPWRFTTGSQVILIHKKCADSLARILNYIWEQCGKSQDQIHKFGYDVFDGSYNYRPIAGTSTLSEHAYGAALDFNAAANPQHAPLTKTKFKEDSLIVQAFKEEGWTWGGDWSPAYIDAMHFQSLKT